MKSLKVQILFTVLAFVSVCGAPRGRSLERVIACETPCSGKMVRAKPKPKAGSTRFKKEDDKNKAAVKIQRAVRKNKKRSRAVSDASSTTASPRSRRGSATKEVPSGVDVKDVTVLF